MNWVDQLKEALPDYVKDTKFSLEHICKIVLSSRGKL